MFESFKKKDAAIFQDVLKMSRFGFVGYDVRKQINSIFANETLDLS